MIKILAYLQLSNSISLTDTKLSSFTLKFNRYDTEELNTVGIYIEIFSFLGILKGIKDGLAHIHLNDKFISHRFHLLFVPCIRSTFSSVTQPLYSFIPSHVYHLHTPTNSSAPAAPSPAHTAGALQFPSQPQDLPNSTHPPFPQLLQYKTLSLSPELIAICCHAI